MDWGSEPQRGGALTENTLPASYSLTEETYLLLLCKPIGHNGVTQGSPRAVLGLQYLSLLLGMSCETERAQLEFTELAVRKTILLAK